MAQRLELNLLANWAVLVTLKKHAFPLTFHFQFQLMLKFISSTILADDQVNQAIHA